MSKLVKIILIALLVIALAFGTAFVTARYLVSKLDGTGNVPQPSALVQYSSEDGISFMYPETYELSSAPGAPGEGDTLVLLPKGYVAPVGGEGPPAITMRVIRNATTSLEQWIRTDPRSNFALSSDKVLGSTEVGGEPAFQYSHSGLYENDAFAVKHGDKLFLFEAGWSNATDRIRYDFQTLVSSVQFTQ